MASLDQSAVAAEVTSQMGLMKAKEAKAAAIAEARSAEEAAREQAREQELRDLRAREQELRDSWKVLTEDERQAKMRSMCSVDAKTLVLTSGIRAGYSCNADQWGNCQGCREHDI